MQLCLNDAFGWDFDLHVGLRPYVSSSASKVERCAVH